MTTGSTAALRDVRRRRILIGLIAATASLLPGCAGGRRAEPRASPVPYAGPDIRLDSTGSQHVAVLHAPSAGWSFALDAVEPRSAGTDAFVTATRPDPAFMHAQVVTPLSVGTGVASNKPITLLVRVLDFGAPGRGASYSRVAAAP